MLDSRTGDTMGKDRIIPIFAMILILIGCLSSLYVYANTVDTHTITINDQELTYEQLFEKTNHRTIDTYEGIALDDLINKSGVTEPTHHDYTIIGADGYQKTVKWEHLQNGLLTPEGQVIFSNLAKTFRVRDVVTIKVI